MGSYLKILFQHFFIFYYPFLFMVVFQKTALLLGRDPHFLGRHPSLQLICFISSAAMVWWHSRRLSLRGEGLAWYYLPYFIVKQEYYAFVVIAVGLFVVYYRAWT